MRSVEECYRGSSVRVFRLDGQAIRQRLVERARRLLAERSDVLEVRLFGSLARDDARPGSDADLLIVLREGAGPFLERTPALARWFEGTGVGCDVFAYTESELARLDGEGNALVRAAQAEGIVMARREG